MYCVSVFIAARRRIDGTIGLDDVIRHNVTAVTNWANVYPVLKVHVDMRY